MFAPPAYHRSSYIAALNVPVLEVEVGAGEGGAYVVTADTVFYPGGGGQPADQGVLGGVPLVGVERTPWGWRHALGGPPPPGLTSGSEVGLALDWARRFDHMQQHTAQHVLSALAEDRWGWRTTAFHLGAGRSDVELDTPALSRAELDTLEEAVMTVVHDELPVSTWYVSVAEYEALGTRSRGLPEGHEGDVRLVGIGQVDVTACGGTHLASTAQIEAVKLLATEPMRGGTRLHWVAGGRVRRRLGAHEERSETLRRLFGVPDEELAAQAGARLDQLREAERRGRWLEGLLADEAAGRLAASGDPVVDAHFEGMDAGFLKAVTTPLQRALGGRLALLTAARDGAHAFVLVAGDQAATDLPAIGGRVAALLEGRGGGAGRVFQGRAGSLARRTDALEVVRGAQHG